MRLLLAIGWVNFHVLNLEVRMAKVFSAILNPHQEKKSNSPKDFFARLFLQQQ